VEYSNRMILCLRINGPASYTQIACLCEAVFTAKIQFVKTFIHLFAKVNQ